MQSGSRRAWTWAALAPGSKPTQQLASQRAQRTCRVLHRHAERWTPGETPGRHRCACMLACRSAEVEGAGALVQKGVAMQQSAYQPASHEQEAQRTRRVLHRHAERWTPGETPGRHRWACAAKHGQLCTSPGIPTVCQAELECMPHMLLLFPEPQRAVGPHKLHHQKLERWLHRTWLAWAGHTSWTSCQTSGRPCCSRSTTCSSRQAFLQQLHLVLLAAVSSCCLGPCLLRERLPLAQLAA